MCWLFMGYMLIFITRSSPIMSNVMKGHLWQCAPILNLRAIKPKTCNRKADVGLEWQQTDADINNYGNVMGARDTAQTLDKINTNQHFIFGGYSADLLKHLHIEGDFEFKIIMITNSGTCTRMMRLGLPTGRLAWS